MNTQNRPHVYLQDGDGQDVELTVTSCDPDDGTYCAHLPNGQWVRICPDSPTKVEREYVTIEFELDVAGMHQFFDLKGWSFQDDLRKVLFENEPDVAAFERMMEYLQDLKKISTRRTTVEVD